MEVFIAIAIIFFVIALLSRSNNKTTKVSQTGSIAKSQNEKTNKMSDDEIQKDILKSLLANIKVSVSSPTANDSIIDVSGNSQKLPSLSSSNQLTVPYWSHFYVYSYNDLQHANTEQKLFYEYVKRAFLNNTYVDLQGNNNYAFILLFDLLNEYEKHKSIDILENQLKSVAENYPRTRLYCKSFLVGKMKDLNDYDGITRIEREAVFQGHFYGAGYENQYYNLGDRFKTKLDLSPAEIILTNKLVDPGNNFSAIEFCLLQTIRLYLSVISELDKIMQTQATTLEKEFESIAGLITTKHFLYREGSQNFRYAVLSSKDELYRMLFKHSENALREYFSHKRKLNTDLYYVGDVKLQLETRITSKLPAIFVSVLPQIEIPDQETEIALNAQNTSRWKIAFDKIKNTHAGKPKEFMAAIVDLGKLNKDNPSIENIFFEASKHIAKADKETSLKLYVYYLYYDLNSSSFDNKQLTKTIQKSLFGSNEQLHDFEKIIAELIKDKDLDKALQGVSQIYVKKRRKIKLDADAITEVRQKHSSTVEILDEIMGDDFEDETSSIHSVQINKEEIQIEILQKTEPLIETQKVNRFGLNPIQEELLGMFPKHSFTVPAAELESFARSKGLFKSQLIDSINETCYEELDDLLIEEEEDNYIVNEQYFQRIILS